MASFNMNASSSENLTCIVICEWCMLKKIECCNNLGCAEESGGGGCPKYRKEVFCVLNSVHHVT